MKRILILSILISACSDYKLSGDGDGNNGGDGGDDTGGTPGDGPEGACDPELFPAERVGTDDGCPTEPEGGFTPIEEWVGGSGYGCLSQPLVADLDADGNPEVILTLINLLGTKGWLTVLDGRTGVTLWQTSTDNFAYGSPPAVADIDHDGKGEIIAVREYQSALLGEGEYAAVRFEDDGTETWESEHFTGASFDWATAPVISDMNHDGTAEIVVGRVILTISGDTRGEGQYGRGSYGQALGISESSVPAVVDLDLDGTEEVIVGDARYDLDGNTLWHDDSQEDAMIGVANLDDDPEGEIVAISYNTIRAVDTDGSIIWGPTEIPSANILATPAIGDLDDDGYPEIVTAGGNRLVVLNHDGTELWRASITDKSGASGASIFDFEGDGIPEVVYIDEVEMIAFEGSTGRIKFYDSDHTSGTMFDYPTVADVDADGHAEILVCHNGMSYAVTAFGDADDSWAPVRQVWNQHAYSINNINDDLSVPVTAVPAFTTHNTWHSAIALDGALPQLDLQAEVLEVCTDDCDEGVVWVTARETNRGTEDVTTDTTLSLYAEFESDLVPLDATLVPATLVSGWSSEARVFEVDAADLVGATAVWVFADDDGAGGAVAECREDNNGFRYAGPFCE
ncbi:MAG: VCBS repeat-containing protein [Deltaproteobacteria bacterium]|nr:MAG: VCBS repeat-containing protein [Deltaproteobacteria bacterium]